ncbi:hypothetical protein HMPREF0765_3984 [Sphingobacterium spiritivorum ATCC 33300]|uniref:Uncharacterized protein n=1 Tax=Sphingobacterium spiritivorum ATCC 33300 TaxID=525372 RepID=C2G328_SPHSI|nr:hypothetical protein HMPREF0765_3984 [Sphingobacterium spiritivorum ATCC 33300]
MKEYSRVFNIHQPYLWLFKSMKTNSLFMLNSSFINIGDILDN